MGFPPEQSPERFTEELLIDRLTEALSDRCAYLIATSIKSRRNIKERFKDFYKIRSKIVHGAINHLDRENIIQLEFAKHFLRSAIRKEMQYIMPQLK